VSEIYLLLVYILSITYLQSIFEQAKKINPDFQFEEAGSEADELETRALEARNRAHIICNIGGTHGRKGRPDGLYVRY
jgi:hypothetical protein